MAVDLDQNGDESSVQPAPDDVIGLGGEDQDHGQPQGIYRSKINRISALSVLTPVFCSIDPQTPT